MIEVDRLFLLFHRVWQFVENPLVCSNYNWDSTRLGLVIHTGKSPVRFFCAFRWWMLLKFRQLAHWQWPWFWRHACNSWPSRRWSRRCCSRSRIWRDQRAGHVGGTFSIIIECCVQLTRSLSERTAKTGAMHRCGGNINGESCSRCLPKHSLNW